MSKQRSVTVPALKFGTGRTGSVQLSVGKRGRVVVKGDATFSLHEMRAIVSQISWFLTQVDEAASTSMTSTTPPTRGPLEQLSLPWGPGVAQSAEGSASGNTRTAIIS